MEDQNSKLDRLLEAVADQPTRVEFNELRQDVAELKQDVKVVKVAVKAANKDYDALDKRVTRLEAA